ncbi:MAG TPA: type II secretion system protein [Polyangiaceae bacterium]|jgi:general secretion pathway protein I
MTLHAPLLLRLRAHGFTLLEVLVAIAILGLGLTVILGSQVGLFSSASRGERIGVATNLLRCKMSELEVKLLQQGYPIGDQHDEGPCCGDDDTNEGYHCTWKIEAVKLPELPLGADGGVNSAGDGGGLDFGALGSFTQLGKGGASPLGTATTPGGLAQSLSNAPSPAGLLPMMMSMVYPNLKPMLEASIRKLTVTVQYKEGKTPRELSASQYVTNPQQGQLDPFAMEGGVPPGGGTLPPGGGTLPPFGGH